MTQPLIVDVEKAINAWISSSDSNYEEMMDFFNIGRNNWALFIGHLCI
jgi:hypothetical protein